jgi:hypothetical protein
MVGYLMAKKKIPNPDGRTPKKLDWKLAESLAKIQCTQGEICSILDVDDVTFYKAIKREYKVNYSEWYAKYSDGGKASLRRRLFAIAHSDTNRGATSAAIWLSKNYLGMKENYGDNVNDRPIRLSYVLDEEKKLDGSKSQARKSPKS